MNKSSVLVVEDNREVAMMIGVILEDLPGVELDVATVGNGQEALDHLRAFPATDLVILDLRMPKKAGVEFLREREANPALKKVPVVLLSGDITLTDVAKQFGIKHYIEKGGGAEKLIATIKAILAENTPAK